MSAARSALVPTMRTTMGTSRVCCARASMRPRATSSPRAMPPKMLTRMARTDGSDEDQAHRGRDLVGASPTADVQEVGRLAAGPLDEVHGGHGQAGAVDHAADGALQADEAEAQAAGLDIDRVLLVQVAQLLQLPGAGRAPSRRA